VVVMIIFAVLMYLVGMFLGPTLGRQMDQLLTGTKEGRIVEESVKALLK
jgi:uncharacterized protein YneF (UPF0154 family)